MHITILYVIIFVLVLWVIAERGITDNVYKHLDRCIQEYKTKNVKLMKDLCMAKGFIKEANMSECKEVDKLKKDLEIERRINDNNIATISATWKLILPVLKEHNVKNDTDLVTAGKRLVELVGKQKASLNAESALIDKVSDLIKNTLDTHSAGRGLSYIMLRLNDLIRLVDKQADEIKEKDKRIEELENELEESKTAAVSYKLLYLGTEKDNEGLKDEIVRSKRCGKNITAEYGALQRVRAELEQENRYLRERYNQAVYTAGKRIEELKLAIAAKDRHITNIECSSNGLEQELKAMTARVEVLEKHKALMGDYWGKYDCTILDRSCVHRAELMDEVEELKKELSGYKWDNMEQHYKEQAEIYTEALRLACEDMDDTHPFKSVSFLRECRVDATIKHYKRLAKKTLDKQNNDGIL